MGALSTITGGHVYVIEVCEGVCKIGASNNPDLRISNLSVCSPNGFIRSHTSARVDAYMTIEKLAHEHFSEHRIRRELFEIDFDDAIREVDRIVANGQVVAPPATKVALPIAEDRVKVAITFGRLIASLESVGIVEMASEQGFDEATLKLLPRISPECAAIAMAAYLSGDAPSVEIAYAAASKIANVTGNVRCAEECNRAARNVAGLLQ